jgi:hypothetical protein
MTQERFNSWCHENAGRPEVARHVNWLVTIAHRHNLSACALIS